MEFVRKHAQEMSEEVMIKHIKLYVNRYSLDLGADGRKAVDLMFKVAAEKGIIEKPIQNLFVA
jgi:1,4-dihydroxy-6-naphthoate synthase